MVRAEFAHLKPNEKEIAIRFRNNAFLLGEYVYDVHLEAELVVWPAWYTKSDIKHWQKLRAKRIDLLVKTEEAHWVLEITPKLSKAAVGGVLAYRDLYMAQYKPHQPVNVGIVVEVDDLAYHPTLKKNNIRLWVV